MKKFKVTKSKCAGCGVCTSVCPQKAIKISKDQKAEIDPKKCNGCGECLKVCPFSVIEETKMQSLIV